MVLDGRSPPSFSFATYNGKTDGQPAIWLSFWGTYTMVLNESMLRLLIDTLDNGADEDGSLEDEIFDLVEALEALIDRETAHKETGMFLVATFNNVFTVQCRVDGLSQLREAINAGADYETFGGPSLYALVGQCDSLIAKERERRAVKAGPVPTGYAQPAVPKQRRRRSAVAV